MNNKLKTGSVIVLLIACISVTYAFPKVKYQGTRFVSSLKIPLETPHWKGADVTDKLNILPDSDVFNFLSEAVGYQYTNKKGDSLLFIIIDAGNFHHPNVCFTYAGYEIEEMNDTEFKVPNHLLKTHTLYTVKERDNYITFYWIVIDKNISHQWIEQKVKQLYFSLFNKERVGLMVRVDIPTTKNNIDHSIAIAKNFIEEMSMSLPREKAEHIFGK